MTAAEHPIRIAIPPFSIEGTATLPDQPRGLVVFAQGSAASRLSRRDRFICEVLHCGRLGTARLDLITWEEGEIDEATRLEWSDVHLLAGRLVIATDWLGQQAATRDLALGYFGVGSGASVALVAASARSAVIRAVALRDGRPDLIEPALPTVVTPALLVVRNDDQDGLRINRHAIDALASKDKELRLVPPATRPGPELEQVARAICDWFVRFLSPPEHATSPGSRAADDLDRAGRVVGDVEGDAAHETPQPETASRSQDDQVRAPA